MKDMNRKNEHQEDEYMSVSDFAEHVGLSPDTLRHYDKEGVFRPVRRGKNGNGFDKGDNGYRFYSPMQITAVKMVRTLAGIDVPLQTIKELSKTRTPEKMIKLLPMYKCKIGEQIENLQNAFAAVDTYMELLHEGMSANENEIVLSKMPKKHLILGRVNDYSGGTGSIKAYTRFCNSDHEPSINLFFPVGGYFTSMEDFMREPSLPTRYFSLDPRGHEKKEAGLYMVGYARGYYGQTGDLPERMAEYAKKNGLLFCGPVYNIYVHDELSIVDENQYLLQASVQVKKSHDVDL